MVLHDPPWQRSRLTVQEDSDDRIIVAKMVVGIGPDGIVQGLSPADPHHLRPTEASPGQFGVLVPEVRPWIVVVVVVMAVVRRVMLGARWQRAIGILRHRSASG